MENQEAATPKKPMTKTEIVASLSEATDLTKQQVTGLFDELAKLIEKNLNEDGPGEFAIPGLINAHDHMYFNQNYPFHLQGKAR